MVDEKIQKVYHRDDENMLVVVSTPVEDKQYQRLRVKAGRVKLCTVWG